VTGTRIEQGVTILDLKDASMKIFSKKVHHLIKLASKIGQDYYPEIMGQMYIINAPMLFSGIWAIVKGFLDERTRKKISIQGSKYIKDLLLTIDPDNLPTFIGGNCTCEEYGGCMQSELGPWNDFEVTYPVGIRRKEAIENSDSKEETKADFS
jgi:hypothetical protein